MGRQALEGVRVADFTTSAAGGLVTKCLADHGAVVVKVESKTHPDITRLSAVLKDNIPGLNRGGIFLHVNSSKYSLGLNLNTPRAIDVAKKLASWADVVVESFSPGVMERWGLGYEKIKQLNPNVVMASLSLQGQTGPLARVPGWGTGVKGLAGYVSLTGWPDRDAVGPYFSYTDYVQPLYGVIAVIAALDYRRRTGKGLFIDISQFETGVEFLSPAILDYTVNGRVQSRRGNRADCAAPHGAFRCKGDDRWCTIAVRTDKEWEAFCQVMGNPDCAIDARFSTILGRKENEEELERLVEKWTVNYTPEEVMNVLQAAGIPAGVVQSCQDLIEKDPQLRHRNYFRVLEHCELGPCAHQAWSFELSGTPQELRPAPCLGEHTRFVCREILGIDDEEFRELLSEATLETWREDRGTW